MLGHPIPPFEGLLPTPGCWEPHRHSLPQKSIILLSPIPGLWQAGAAGLVHSGRGKAPDARRWQEGGGEAQQAGSRRAHGRHVAVPMVWLWGPGCHRGAHPIALTRGSQLLLESQTIPWAQPPASPPAPRSLPAATEPGDVPVPTVVSQPLAAWSRARRVNPLTWLSPMQKGDKTGGLALWGHELPFLRAAG